MARPHLSLTIGGVFYVDEKGRASGLISVAQVGALSGLANALKISADLLHVDHKGQLSSCDRSICKLNNAALKAIEE